MLYEQNLPLTREWAHDKFVEKEKKYHWKLNGFYLTRDESDKSLFFYKYDDEAKLKRSELQHWGFNPEMFDKEEA